MSFTYTETLIHDGLSYEAYRNGIKTSIAREPANEQEQKMRPYVEKNSVLMDQFDESYSVSERLKTTILKSPPAFWLVLTEGWCGDAAFNVPMLAAVEKAIPEKITLKLFLRDSNLELMDAHLTEGGRSIPKLIVLSENLEELGTWGPRPAALQELMKVWKAEGLSLKEIIPRVHNWYNLDSTRSVQEELISLVKGYF